MFLPILLFLCEKGGYIFSRRGRHDRYILNSAFFALSVWNRERFCALFHAEVADYTEIFGTVFVVALLGYVLRSLRSLRGIGKDSVFFSRRGRRLRGDIQCCLRCRWISRKLCYDRGRRGRHDLIYMWNCVLCVLCVKKECCVVVMLADYMKMFWFIPLSARWHRRRCLPRGR